MEIHNDRAAQWGAGGQPVGRGEEEEEVRPCATLAETGQNSSPRRERVPEPGQVQWGPRQTAAGLERAGDTQGTRQSFCPTVSKKRQMYFIS